LRNVIVCAVVAAVAVAGAAVMQGQVSLVAAAPFTEAAVARLDPSYESEAQLAGDLVASVAGKQEITDADESASPPETETGEPAENEGTDGRSEGGGSGNESPGQDDNAGDSDSGNDNDSGNEDGDRDNDVPEKKEEDKKDEPGDIPTYIDEAVDDDCFETSIADGATTYEREYRFTITHKRKNLKVKSVAVTVGGKDQSQWSGRIELEEGTNAIRVTARYTDKAGKTISVYRDYTLHAMLGDILIQTTLAEVTGKTVHARSLSFTAGASYGSETIPLSVACDGAPLSADPGSGAGPGSGNNYTLNLKEGRNVIALSARKGEKSAAATYDVTYAKPENLNIVTSLTSGSQSDPQVINEPRLTFSAAVEGGTGGAKLVVVCDGVTLEGRDGGYETVVNKLNKPVTVRMKASETIDGQTETVTALYYVKYAPIATEETAPRMKHINVTDGMNVAGVKFTLDIEPVDYEGKALGYNNVVVRLNGETVDMRWMSEYLSYALTFVNGENVLDVRITDNNGRYADYSYTVSCSKLEDGDSLGTITVSVDAAVLGLGYLIEPAEVEIFEGETGARVVDRLLGDKGFTYEHTGTLTSDFYLARVARAGVGRDASVPADLVEALANDGYAPNDNRDDDSIGEFDYYKGSGWMYSRNGSFPGHGFTDGALKDGDVIKIRFTLAYGKDIGGYRATGGDDLGNYGKVW
jgi:hypothetical protein